MRFHEYVEQREAMNEADMPPPSPPAIIRAADYNLNTSGKNLFRQVMSDNLQKFNGDIKKAIEYSANWQPSEKDSLGFVGALKDAAKKHNVELHLPSWLKKYDSPVEYHGFKEKLPSLDKINFSKFSDNDSGKSLFKQVMRDNLQKFNGDMKKAIEYSANWQPSEKDSPGFVKALKDAADANDIFVHIPSWLKKYE